MDTEVFFTENENDGYGWVVTDDDKILGKDVGYEDAASAASFAEAFIENGCEILCRPAGYLISQPL